MRPFHPTFVLFSPFAKKPHFYRNVLQNLPDFHPSYLVGRGQRCPGKKTGWVLVFACAGGSPLLLILVSTTNLFLPYFV